MAEKFPPPHPTDNYSPKKKKGRPSNLSGVRERTVEILRRIAPDAPARMTTEELAKLMGIKADSVRHSLCTRGHYAGLVPLRLPNGRLLWQLIA